MTKKIINDAIDIYQYPEKFADNLGSITIGDLHGNAVKLLHFLLRNNVLKFKSDEEYPAESYKNFVDLYEKSATFVELSSTISLAEERVKSITRDLNNYDSREVKIQVLRDYLLKEYQDAITNKTDFEEELRNAQKNILEEFNQFLSRLEVKDRNVLVRLIGDEVADRGSNDYFTLRLLKLLQESGVKLSITISNHGNEFIIAYEHLLNDEGFFSDGMLLDSYKPSFWGLKVLYDSGFVSKEEITTLVNTVYKPSLKILDYTLNDEGITLFTHAPVRFDFIRHIASNMSVIYNDSTKENLAITIDEINTKFTQIVENNQVHEHCITRFIDIIVEDMRLYDIASMPLIHITWNRWDAFRDTEDARPNRVNDYEVSYFHGHDPYPSKFQHIYNLDTYCGKGTRKAQAIEIDENKAILANENVDSITKIQAQNELDRYCDKILDSNERSLQQQDKPRLIEQEFILVNQPSPRKDLFSRFFIAGGLLVGAVIGVALVLLGIFAPLGAVALAVIIGGCLALASGVLGKSTGALPVNTVVSTSDSISGSSKALSQLGESAVYGTEQEPMVSLSIFPSIAKSSQPLITEEMNSCRII